MTTADVVNNYPGADGSSLTGLYPIAYVYAKSGSSTRVALNCIKRFNVPFSSFKLTSGSDTVAINSYGQLQSSGASGESYFTIYSNNTEANMILQKFSAWFLVSDQAGAGRAYLRLRVYDYNESSTSYGALDDSNDPVADRQIYVPYNRLNIESSTIHRLLFDFAGNHGVAGSIIVHHIWLYYVDKKKLINAP